MRIQPKIRLVACGGFFYDEFFIGVNEKSIRLDSDNEEAALQEANVILLTAGILKSSIPTYFSWKSI